MNSPQHIYNTKPILEASYLNQSAAKDKLGELGYKYDPILSTNEQKVFIDPLGRPHIAFRGSQRISDWVLNDTLIAAGLSNLAPRVQKGRELVQKVEAKYGKPADVYGSSLGGTVAEYSGAHGNIITHNKGVGIAEIGKVIPKNQTDIRSSNDLVSLLSITQPHKGNFITTPGVINPIQSHLPTALGNDIRFQ